MRRQAGKGGPPLRPPRRFCLALLGGNALSTVAFAAYTAAGIDALSQSYIGYFYWSAPVLMLLVIFLAGTESLAERWSAPRFATGIAVALALAGARFSVWAPGSVPRGMPVLFQLRRGIVTYSPK